MTDRARRFTPALLVALAAVVVHWGSLDGAFLEWDDALLVSDNPVVKKGGLSDLGAMLTPSKDRVHYGLEYLPVRDLSNRLDRLLFGLDPRGYHLGNILYFGVAAAALFGVLFTLLGDRRAAMLGALLFAVHPAATESVACIAHRKDVLMAAFGLLAWLAWLRERRVLALFLFAAAVLSKLPAIALPPVMLITDLALRRRFDLRRVLFLAGLGAIAATATAISMSIAPALGGATWHGGSVLTNALSVGVAFLESVRLLLFPVGLHVGRVNETMTRTSPDAASVAGLVLLLVLLAIGVMALLRQRRRPTTRGLVLVVSTLGLLALQAPYLQIRPFWVLFAERYLIMALVPLAFAAAAFLPSGRRWSIGAAAVLVLLAGLTIHRETKWSDTRTLFTDACEKEPRSYIAHDKVGRLLLKGAAETEARAQGLVQQARGLADQAAQFGRAGRTLEANQLKARSRQTERIAGDLLASAGRDYAAARTMFRQAVRAAEELRPRGQLVLEDILLNARQDLINALMAERRWEDARAEAVRWTEGWPDSWLARFFTGLVAQKSGRIEEAEGHYREAIRLADLEKARVPMVAMAHYNLGILYRNREQLGCASSLAEFEAAGKVNPGMAQVWAELSRGYGEIGRWRDVARVLRRGLEVQPDNMALLHDLATVLEQKLGRRDEARPLRQRIRELSRPR